MRFSAAPALLMLLASASDSIAAGVLAEKGRELSLLHCGRCHVVDPGRGFGGIGSTPSFKTLMTLKDGEERFITFFERRPHPSFIRMSGVERLTPLPSAAAEIALTSDDLDAILVYVRTLQKVVD